MADEQPMEERARRIVESAVELAERGGFEAVRVRDIAAEANVALGTLYKRFSSKEDILVAALEHEVGLLEKLLTMNPVQGESPVARVKVFFSFLTTALTAKTKLSRAVLRATVSGEPALTEKVERFHGRIRGLIASALLGGGEAEDLGFTDEQLDWLAFTLSQVWFAAIVGWMSGLFGSDDLMKQVESTAHTLVAGMRAQQN